MKIIIAALIFIGLSLVHVGAQAQTNPQNMFSSAKNADTIIASVTANEFDEFWTAVKVSLFIGGVYLVYWLKAGAIDGGK